MSTGKKSEFEKIVQSKNQLLTLIGQVGGLLLKINNDIIVKVENLADTYFNILTRIMSGEK